MSRRDGETAEEHRRRVALEEQCHGLARAIAAAVPPGTGFALLLFDFGSEGSFAYAANANRDDVVKLLGEAREKIRGA